MKKIKNVIYNQDCIDGLADIAANSIDACITDPPYNYEFIGHKWDHEEINRRIERVKNSKTLVKHVPYGSGLAGGVRNARWYEKNARNVVDYRVWTEKWAAEVFRVMKPGAYIMVFNSTRTVAHVQVALESVGFYARDIIVWKKNSGIPKGINLSKKLQKEGMPDAEKWEGWHSALRNEWEAIALLQKPLENNYPNTVQKWGVGVMKTINKDGGFQSNILNDIPREPKEDFNVHCTVKPVNLIQRLVEMIVPQPGADKIILDPFMGSGTTAIAAINLGVGYLGFEIVKDYVAVSENRISRLQKEKNA
jgi:site-specific DNA-methyltransferase (adenine-specific)